MPIFFALYYIMPKKMKDIILIFGSLSFYYVGTIGHFEHFIVFICSILMDYIVGILIEKYQKKKKVLLMNF